MNTLPTIPTNVMRRMALRFLFPHCALKGRALRAAFRTFRAVVAR